MIWDNWGVVADVKVCLPLSHRQLIADMDTIQPFMHYFPRADIHELLSPDLLHQLIKGTFKDHIVAWVEAYLEHEHGEAEAKKIMDDIDRRYISFAIALTRK